MTDLFNTILKTLKSNRPCVLATVVATHGSAPRHVGAKMLIFKNGSIQGTIGGGNLEKLVIADAAFALKKGSGFLKDYPLDKKSGFQVCGGKVTIFIEALEPPRSLVICGAGHIGLALSFLGKLLGISVTILDNRAAFANKKRFPHVDRILCGAYPSIIKKAGLDKNTFVVIVTHQHSHDLECLETALGSPTAYVGMIGSLSKIRHNFEQLKKKGFMEKVLKKIHAPIGLDIGAQTPEEIAVAIAGEIVQVHRSQGPKVSRSHVKSLYLEH